jgi:hypothetical protein
MSGPVGTTPNSADTPEHKRLQAKYSGPVDPWRKWGPYVSERAWGSVREDYSADGNAWNSLTHDMARSKAYRWGEDGIAALCDRYQVLVFALALWNGRDPILKERMFGLTCDEGNHGEDVKEYWFYLDSTPTHSYMRMLYKYPQAAFPYAQLIEENRRRAGANQPEYELLDTGIFDQNHYFDVFVEYAKVSEEDIAIRIEAINHAPEAATLHLLPHLWFRNTWGWTDPRRPEPIIQMAPQKRSAPGDAVCLVGDDTEASALANLQFPYKLGRRFLYAPADGTPLFTNNESNAIHLYGASTNPKPFVKDGFHRHVIHGETSIEPAQRGTKSCIWYQRSLAPGESWTLRLRLTPHELESPLKDVDASISTRRAEADEFYETVHPPRATAEERRIQRQALAGMLWSKVFYYWDVDLWLNGDNLKFSPPGSRKRGRNIHWRHLNSMRILSMPDKWEFPWFAAWDLAFQCVTLALVDPYLAKENLWLLLFEQFQHPNGQIPAYEWEFSDLNPPVHAWACWRVYELEKQRTGFADTAFLEKCLHKLLMNFAWWVNRVDSEGNNVFEGGFLGLDNIAVIDRGEKFPGGAILEQSDATGWMGFFCLYLMKIALELARTNKVYEGVATKFFEHFIYIGSAMKKMGGRDYQLWDEKDGFFYDVLRYPNGEFHKFRLRSLVGLIPLYAIEVLCAEDLEPFPAFKNDVEWFLSNRADLVGDACYREARGERYVLSIAAPDQFARLLRRLSDPGEFLSPYGLRSISKYHERHPFEFAGRSVGYEPGEAVIRIKGGNSNWRGPIWFPTSYLLIHSLLRFGQALRDEPHATGEGRTVTPSGFAQEVANRMIAIFTRDKAGHRPSSGEYTPMQMDPLWSDLVLFHEYYHGDTGKGLGASHQTGWSGLIANLIDEWRR